MRCGCANGCAFDAVGSALRSGCLAHLQLMLMQRPFAVAAFQLLSLCAVFEAVVRGR